MAPIYSQKLVNASYPASQNAVIYTVPASTTVVVTNIDMYYHSNAANSASYVEIGATNLLYHLTSGTEISNLQWVGKQVLNAGDTITYVTGNETSRLAITGYVLGP